ncbi:MAG: stage II sporulation protein R [Clostridia bacterium]|nr:stage II sporulation protein R [Clostridia bacterium]
MIAKQTYSRLIAALCCLTLLLCLGAAYLPVHGEGAVYDAVIRLHVLANSDSAEDQALKMQVRDAVLSQASAQLSDCTTREQAKARLQALLPSLEQIAEQTLRASGCEDNVIVTLGEESYPTRSYDGFCFPAGNYLSLRVMIGKSEGQNFWCVLFPPMCMSAASVPKESAEEALISVGLSKDQYSIITETQNKKYRLRFRLLEVFEELFAS